MTGTVPGRTRMIYAQPTPDFFLLPLSTPHIGGVRVGVDWVGPVRFG